MIIGRAGVIIVWLIAVLLVVATLGAGMAAAQEGPLPDAAITAEVERAFAADATLRRMDIRVETRAGIVSLSGFVRSLEDMVKASELAHAVGGVSAVRNRLRVENRPSRA